MTQNAIATIRAIPDMLRRRNIQATKGYRFDSDWAEGLIAFFCQDHAVRSVAFHAALDLDGTWYNGFVEVDRDGFLIIRRKHGA